MKNKPAAGPLQSHTQGLTDAATPAAPEIQLQILDVRQVTMAPKALAEAHIRILGKGRGALNRAASIQLGQIAQQRKLDTDTPRGALFALDVLSGNPVVIPTAVAPAEGIAVNWHEAGRRAFLHIGPALSAWNRVIEHKGTSVIIPTEVLPTDRGPVLMLRWDQRFERAQRTRRRQAP